MSSSPGARRPLLIVVSAPSGAGKTTLCDRLRAERPDILYSVSCTTRPPRGEERDGEDYHFISAEQFDRYVAEGRFLECAEVHGARYGTPRAAVEAAFARGRSVLMDIDVQGARQVRAKLARRDGADPLARGFVDIFIAPPSLDVLRRRIVDRGEDPPEAIERRIRNAAGEMACAGEFRYVVVNDKLDEAYHEFRSIVEKEADAAGG